MGEYTFREKVFQFERYPKTSNRSLRPVSAADELLIDYVLTNIDRAPNFLVQHDRFGVLTTIFADQPPQFVETFASQKKALVKHLTLNGELPMPKTLYSDTLPAAAEIGVMRVPKSLQLFERYVAQYSWMAKNQAAEA